VIQCWRKWMWSGNDVGGYRSSSRRPPTFNRTIDRIFAPLKGFLLQYFQLLIYLRSFVSDLPDIRFSAAVLRQFIGLRLKRSAVVVHTEPIVKFFRPSKADPVTIAVACIHRRTNFGLSCKDVLPCIFHNPT